MARTGRPRLSAEEHQRRGNYRPGRHAAPPTVPHRLNYRTWLRGLSPLAQGLGRHALECGVVPGDREAWRAYLEALARYDRWVAERPQDPEALTAAGAHLTKLLTAVRARWR